MTSPEDHPEACRKPKVLLTVYTANPHAQSEPLGAYKYLREIDKVADMRVIVHIRYRQDFADVPFADKIHYAGNIHLAKITRRIGVFLFKDSWGKIGLLDWFDYLFFDFDCLRKARWLHGQEHFDLVHRITPKTIRWASRIWRLGIPSISGPHNGGLTWPKGFRHLARKEGTMERVRPIGNLMHILYGDFGKYDRILVNRHTRSVIPAKYHYKTIDFFDQGVDQVFPQSPHAGDARRLVFVGRIVPVKCLHILLRAMTRIPETCTLTVVGDGPLIGDLKKMAEELSLSQRVTFTGWVKQHETYDYLQKSGVFVFPSPRDGSPGVVLDAMACGLPVLVANWSGPRQIVGEDAGIKLSVGSEKGMEDDLVGHILQLLDHPEEGRRLGARAQERIQQYFIWEAKGSKLLDIYRDVIDTILRSTPGNFVSPSG